LFPQFFRTATPLPYPASFAAFCEEIIEAKIINEEQILKMSKVRELFIKKVKETEDMDASGYR